MKCLLILGAKYKPGELGKMGGGEMGTMGGLGKMGTRQEGWLP
jgi:hypothetical protein